MKKIITFLLVFVLAFSLFAVSASAENENYAKNLKWKQLITASVSESDGVFTATGITQPFHSPGINLLPAINEMLKASDGDDEITVTFSFEARVKFTEANEGETLRARILFRGVNGIQGVNPAEEADEWNGQYTDSLDGEDSLFESDPNGNIMYVIGSADIVDNDWSLIEITKTLTRAQIENKSVTAWNLCIDSLTVGGSPLTAGLVENLQIRNTYVGAPIEEEEPEATPTPTPKPEDKPTTEDKPTEKPQGGTAEKTPVPTQNTSALQTPDLEGAVDDVLQEKPVLTPAQAATINYIGFAVAFVLGIAVGAVITLLIVKKKAKN